MASRELIRPIEIENLRELQAALRQMDGESHKKLREVFNAAAETIAGGARRRVPRGRSGNARGSVKALSQQRIAKVVGGSRKAPYYGWLDFGGTVGRGRTGLGGVASAAGRSNQGTAGSVQRRFVEGGRYIYPSWNANRRSILDALADAISDLAVDAGLTVT